MVFRFVDRDMMMRFHGGGVGHKSTREVTDQFLDDRDPMDTGSGQQELGEDETEKLGLILEDDNDDNSENGEEDYGYMNDDSDAETEWEDVDDDVITDYESQGFDSLGAEDGLDVTDPVEDLGFAAL
jgi:hypothetical protein